MPTNTSAGISPPSPLSSTITPLNIETHKVKVWFDAFAAPFIRERKWNESQKVKTKKDGSLEFSITVNSLIEIKGWLLNWGEHAKVLGPKELVGDMKEELKKMLALY